MLGIEDKGWPSSLLPLGILEVKVRTLYAGLRQTSNTYSLEYFRLYGRGSFICNQLE